MSPLFKCVVFAFIYKLDGCIVWNAHNTVFGLKRSAIRVQVVYFLHLTMPSVTCLRLNAVSVICRITYLHFPIQVCFTSMFFSQADIGRRRKFREVSCTGHRNDFELIPTVKMETRHPVERSFDSEFPSIYNHCGVVKSQDVIVQKVFNATPIDLFCVQIS